MGTGAKKPGETEGTKTERGRVATPTARKRRQGQKGRERAAQAEEGDVVLQARRRSGGIVRGRSASESRNADGRTGGRNTAGRTSRAQAGSRRGLRSTVNRLQRRSGGRNGSASSGKKAAINRPNARSGRGTKSGVARGRNSRAGQRTRSGAHKASKAKAS